MEVGTERVDGEGGAKVEDMELGRKWRKWRRSESGGSGVGAEVEDVEWERKWRT